MHASLQRLGLGKGTFTNSRREFTRRHKDNGDPQRVDQQFLQFPQVEQSSTRKWVNQQPENATLFFCLVQYGRQNPGVRSFVVAHQLVDLESVALNQA